MSYVDAWKEDTMRRSGPRFEEKKFCQIRTLAQRWDSSTDRIYDLLSKGVLRAFHPEGKVGGKGLLIEVASVLAVEETGMIDPDSAAGG